VSAFRSFVVWGASPQLVARHRLPGATHAYSGEQTPCSLHLQPYCLDHFAHMTSLRTLQMLDFAALAVGVVLAILSHRFPKRGWIGVLLLLAACLACALINVGDSSQPTHLWMVVAFLVIAPIAVVYSFRARRVAPDRVPALAAFAGHCSRSVLTVYGLWSHLYFVCFMRLTWSNKSLQATRDGRSSSATRAYSPWGHAPLRGSRWLVPRA